METHDVGPTEEARHQRKLSSDFAVVWWVQNDASTHDVRITILALRFCVDEAVTARSQWKFARKHEIRIVCV